MKFRSLRVELEYTQVVWKASQVMCSQDWNLCPWPVLFNPRLTGSHRKIWSRISGGVTLVMQKFLNCQVIPACRWPPALHPTLMVGVQLGPREFWNLPKWFSCAEESESLHSMPQLPGSPLPPFPTQHFSRCLMMVEWVCGWVCSRWSGNEHPLRFAMCQVLF